jgi:hypothetical protein
MSTATYVRNFQTTDILRLISALFTLSAIIFYFEFDFSPLFPGCVNLIVSDKTGTLTANIMRLRTLSIAGMA